jgi:hypothetical protein
MRMDLNNNESRALNLQHRKLVRLLMFILLVLINRGRKSNAQTTTITISTDIDLFDDDVLSVRRTFSRTSKKRMP